MDVSSRYTAPPSPLAQSASGSNVASNKAASEQGNGLSPKAAAGAHMVGFTVTNPSHSNDNQQAKSANQSNGAQNGHSHTERLAADQEAIAAVEQLGLLEQSQTNNQAGSALQTYTANRSASNHSQYDQPSEQNLSAISAYQHVGNQAARESVQQVFGGSARFSPLDIWTMTVAAGSSRDKSDNFYNDGSTTNFQSRFETQRDTVSLQHDFSFQKEF